MPWYRSRAAREERGYIIKRASMLRCMAARNFVHLVVLGGTIWLMFEAVCLWP